MVSDVGDPDEEPGPNYAVSERIGKRVLAALTEDDHATGSWRWSSLNFKRVDWEGVVARIVREEMATEARRSEPQTVQAKVNELLDELPREEFGKNAPKDDY